MSRTQRMTSLLQEKFNPVFLKLEDESLRHAGHREAGSGDETHYQLTLETAAFAGMSKVKRHQAIYALLGGEFDTGLHALAIHAYAPGERPKTV